MLARRLSSRYAAKVRRALLLLLAAATAFADWSAVERLAPGTRVEVALAKSGVRGMLVRASGDAIAVTAKSGEVSVPRAEVKRVMIASPRKRMRNGLLGVGIGAGAGAVAGALVCLYCRNEGHRGFEAPFAALGAALGAIAFAAPPYETVYRAPKR